jgi:glyoxylase-like metal-dependent hydrolase (beta-lactamase superfamily II)
MSPNMRLQRSLFPLLVLALSALPSSGQGEPVVPSPKPRVTGVDVTFLANAGFFLESGRYSVLIDAFLREPTDLFAGLPDAVYKQLVNAQAPFDELTIVLVSHDHPDHAQMRGLEKYAWLSS